MTHDEADAIAAVLHGKLVTKFALLGIEVTSVPDRNWYAYYLYNKVAEYTFRSVGADKSVPGIYSELTIHFDAFSAYRCRNDSAELDVVVEDWERILRDWVPDLFRRAPGAGDAPCSVVTSG
jgi:hypothetical protein